MSASDNRPAMTPVAGSSASWDGTPLPPYPPGQPHVTILRGTLPPGTRLDLHSHPVINAGFVLRGKLTVVAANGMERTFRAGEGIVEMVGTPHYGENRGGEPVELILFYAGTDGLPLTEAMDGSTTEK